MSNQPTLTVTDNLIGSVLSVGTINGMLVGGVLVGGVLTLAAGVPILVGFVVGAVAAPVVLLGIGLRATRGSEIKFYDDRVETETPFDSEGWGSWDDRTIPYEEIDLVIRRDEFGDRVVGTGSFELLAGTEHMKLSHLTDPDRVAEILNERVPDPSTQIAESEGGYTLWDLWPRDIDPPETPVVEELTLAATLDVYLHGADMDELLPDPEEGSALDSGPEQRLTAQDFDAGGDDSTVLALPLWFAVGLSVVVLALGAGVLGLGLLGISPGVPGSLTPVQQILQVGAGLLVTLLGLSFLSQSLASRRYRARGIAG